MEQVVQICKQSLINAFPEIAAAQLVPVLQNATNIKFGHYQLNNIMPIQKILKAAGKECSVKEISDKIVGELTKMNAPMIAKIAPAAVFVNITLTDKFLLEQAIEKFMTSPETLPKPTPYPKQTIAVDFSSPNVAKSMHVGNLRSTIIGDTVCRLFEYLECDVHRINHVGDWGTQFGMLIAFLMDKNMTDAAHELPITDLVAFYKEAKVRFDEDKEFCERAHQEVVKLQSGSELELGLWKRLCEVSRKEFQRIYQQLDIKLEEVGESFYNPLLQKTVDELTKLGMVQLSNGAQIIDLQEAFPLMVKKTDGGFTYDTTDMAAIKYRAQDLKCNRIIYVTDLGQLPHFQLIFKAAQKAGWIDNCVVEHCGFGVVVGEDGKKLKTRSGETVKLQDLIDESFKQAEEQIKQTKENEYSAEEIAEISKAVGISAIKYADLCSRRTGDYRFSFEKMLSFKGNTASYMLYSFARISSIVRKIGIDRHDIYNKEKMQNLEITADQERNLLVVLLKLDQVVKLMVEDLMPHNLCEWMYSVSTAYTDFYEKCRVINQDGSYNWTRVVLSEMTRQALKFCFYVLGLKEVERM
ncbi:Arginyl-tRNA_synthetase [Hexamita inflata]|uniref:arginine--tRNA ligase n=1 Tax=Hexamita inflata TaxID=28002 RepID=A0AA86NAZ4_9EUKA|nr:Arginyl-tRNA synthetase [Hexamita inflata]